MQIFRILGLEPNVRIFHFDGPSLKSLSRKISSVNVLLQLLYILVPATSVCKSHRLLRSNVRGVLSDCYIPIEYLDVFISVFYRRLSEIYTIQGEFEKNGIIYYAPYISSPIQAE